MERNRYNSDIFCLEYETDRLLELGYSFRQFVKDSAVKYAGMEIAKATVLKAFFGNYSAHFASTIIILMLFFYKAAVALPATILKIADVIDNPWQMVVDRSRKAGTGKI